MLKSFIQKVFSIVILTTTFSLSAFAEGDYQIEDQPHVIENVFHIPQKGILKQKENGYLYLDVSNDFITNSLPLIETPGKILPPNDYTNKKGIGAHISVIYENEQILNEIWEIQELGQEYTFTLMELRTVKLNHGNKVKKLWLIAVDAPELEKLRESYGLSSKLKNEDFHITIGTQIPGKSQSIDDIPLEDNEEFKEAA